MATELAKAYDPREAQERFLAFWQERSKGTLTRGDAREICANMEGLLGVLKYWDDNERAEAAVGIKQQIAFYGSTPAYRGVLDLHGWGDLQPELNALSKQGKWVEMGELITPDILHTFAVVADQPEDVAGELSKRFGDVVDRCSFYAPYKSDPERWRAVVAGLKRA